jgi:Fur family peroxide stress response transcriptional regulator
MIDYSQMLKDNNLKVTPQRVAIVDELYLNGHLNIDELYTLLKSKFPSISLATIYKNMNSMMQNLFVTEVKIPHEKSVYELTKELHSHVVCSNCNHIDDIVLDVTPLLNEANTKCDFKFDDVNVVFTGLCKKCSK